MLTHEAPTQRELLRDPRMLSAVALMKDDTEEDLVGSDLHQRAIRTTHQSLELAGPERGLPWHVSMQLVVRMGLVGSRDWNPSPDVFVHPTAGTEPRTSFDAVAEGVPPLVLEVASPRTWDYDVDVKEYLYHLAGVREYLVFDPTGELLGSAVRAWHQGPTGWETWRAGEDGRWHCATIGVSFRPEGTLLRVHDAEGAVMPILSELARERAALARQQEALARRIAELEAENRRLRGDGA